MRRAYECMPNPHDQAWNEWNRCFGSPQGGYVVGLALLVGLPTDIRTYTTMYFVESGPRGLLRTQ